MSYNLFCSSCGEVSVIKETFYRLFNLFGLTHSIFKMRLSERQQKGKLFRGTQLSNPSNPSLCSQGKAQDTDTLAQKMATFCYDRDHE